MRRNRTFFFTDWQGTRLQQGVVRTSTVPLPAQREGIFPAPLSDPAGRQPFPDNRIPASRFDPVASGLLARYPLPNVSGAAANNYRRTGTDRTAQDQWDGRLDHYFGERHHVFARHTWLHDESRPTPPLPDGSGNLTSGVIGNTVTQARGLAAEHTWTISAASVNQFRFGWTRRGFERTALRLGRPASQETGVPNLPPDPFGGVLPVFQITGMKNWVLR